MRVVIHGLTKTFVTGPKGTRKIRALAGVDLEVRDREFFGVIGPTGCGKTTLLHILAGLETPTAGSVEFIGDKRTEAMVSMVFQDAALMPWRTVADNVPLGPEFRKQSVPIYKRVTQFFLEVVRKSPQPAQRLFMCGVAVKGRIFENGTGRKGNDMKACPSRPGNDGLGIAIHLLLLAQVGNG